MFLILLFITGIFIGSFLNVIIDRLPQNKTFITGRSACEFCHHILSWYDLFPLLSFLFLLGKCRYCKKWIGWKYPLIELITGMSFVLMGILFFLYSPLTPLFLILHLLIICCFIVLFFIDFWHGILPDELLLPIFVLSCILHIVSPAPWINILLSASFAFLFFLFLFLVTKGNGMGLGDVKLVAVLGFFLGFPNILITLYLAFLTGAVVAIILVLYKKKRFNGGTIPFGPFLIANTYIVLFIGSNLWKIIVKLFF